MGITRKEIESIKQSHDLVSEVQSRGIILKRSGKQYVGSCPFHKDTKPSFTVDPEKQLWHCFGCPPQGKGSTGGTIIGFIAKYDNISREEAVKKLQGHNPGINEKAPMKSPAGSDRKELTPKDTASQKPLSPKQQKLLNRVITYYQNTLLKDTRGLEYLQKK